MGNYYAQILLILKLILIPNLESFVNTGPAD